MCQKLDIFYVSVYRFFQISATRTRTKKEARMNSIEERIKIEKNIWNLQKEREVGILEEQAERRAELRIFFIAGCSFFGAWIGKLVGIVPLAKRWGFGETSEYGAIAITFFVLAIVWYFRREKIK